MYIHVPVELDIRFTIKNNYCILPGFRNIYILSATVAISSWYYKCRMSSIFQSLHLEKVDWVIPYQLLQNFVPSYNFYLVAFSNLELCSFLFNAMHDLNLVFTPIHCLSVH